MPDKSPAPKNTSNIPTESNTYAAHLAEVNETRTVVAKDDIFNDVGLLLIKKGNAITPEMVRTIVQFKLTKPIQDSITIQNEVSANDLLQHFVAILQQDQVLNAIHKRYDLHPLLTSQCDYYQTLPMLRQKITVMSERMAETYNRTLWCTWLSLLIAKEMRLDAKNVSIIFLAALSHDIGMLHINPDVLNKKGQLSAEEWRQIQAHVVIGRTILTATPNVPAEVCLAVFEHHERCDGTGYPLGKVESELSVAGQVIALCDSVIAVYFNRFKPQGRGWRDVIPVIQMNNQAYLYRNYEVLVTILRRSELPSIRAIADTSMGDFISKIITQNTQVKQWFTDIKNYIKAIGFTHGDRKLHALQNVILHIATSVAASGIFQDGFVEWLEQVQDEQLTEAYREVEDSYLMQEEVIFHLNRLGRMAKIHLANGGKLSDPLKVILESCIQKSDEFSKALK